MASSLPASGSPSPRCPGVTRLVTGTVEASRRSGGHPRRCRGTGPDRLKAAESGPDVKERVGETADVRKADRRGEAGPPGAEAVAPAERRTGSGVDIGVARGQRDQVRR